MADVPVPEMKKVKKPRVELKKDFDPVDALNRLATRRAKLAAFDQEAIEKQNELMEPLKEKLQAISKKMAAFNEQRADSRQAKLELVQEMEAKIRSYVLDNGATVNGDKAPAGRRKLQCQHVKPSVDADIEQLLGMAKMDPRIYAVLTETESTPRIVEIKE